MSGCMDLGLCVCSWFIYAYIVSTSTGCDGTQDQKMISWQRSPGKKPFFTGFGNRSWLKVFWLVVSMIFYFHPYLGKIPILTNISQRG